MCTYKCKCYFCWKCFSYLTSDYPIKTYNVYVFFSIFVFCINSTESAIVFLYFCNFLKKILIHLCLIPFNTGAGYFFFFGFVSSFLTYFSSFFRLAWCWDVMPLVWCDIVEFKQSLLFSHLTWNLHKILPHTIRIQQ